MESILKKLGVTETENIVLYYEAITHPSFSNEKKFKKTYQRLEFLGDAVLDLLVSNYLYDMKPSLAEGKMSLLKASVVNKTTLAKFSIQIGLDKELRQGNSIDNLDKNEKILSDVFEAFIAALYIDSQDAGLETLLKETVIAEIDKKAGKDVRNPKTALQEYLQAEGLSLMYDTKWNNNVYQSVVYRDNIKFGVGRGRTKKMAEVNAAKGALRKLNREG